MCIYIYIHYSFISGLGAREICIYVYKYISLTPTNININVRFQVPGSPQIQKAIPKLSLQLQGLQAGHQCDQPLAAGPHRRLLRQVPWKSEQIEGSGIGGPVTHSFDINAVV